VNEEVAENPKLRKQLKGSLSSRVLFFFITYLCCTSAGFLSHWVSVTGNLTFMSKFNMNKFNTNKFNISKFYVSKFNLSTFNIGKFNMS